MKKKIELNIYFVPWFLGFCDDYGDCHSIDYNAYTEYLDVFHENWYDNKYLIIGLEATMGNANKKTKPFISLSKYFNCFINKFKLKNKLNLEDKIVIFETFDKYLPRHLSWTGNNKDEIKIYYSPQNKKNFPKRLKIINEKVNNNKKLPSKKKDRPSPSESATQFKVGTKKKGNDGNVWIIVENKNGVKRWNKVKN